MSALNIRRVARWMTAGAGVAVGAYTAYGAVAWRRYGHPAQPKAAERDPLLDCFMPVYEVAERHHVRVVAPAATVLAAAKDVDLQQSGIIRAIFRTRELVLGAMPGSKATPPGLMPQLLSLGWGVLAEVPDREIVVGAVTQPWLANVVFRALSADDFAKFNEPGYVKIVWTLRADAASPSESIFRTETRVMTTDSASRSKFRWYWARFSPGIVVIRRLLLRQLKAEAERRARAVRSLPEEGIEPTLAVKRTGF